MTKQQEFVEWIDALVKACPDTIPMSDNVKAYLDALRSNDSASEKSAFTDNGKAILQWLQTAPMAMYKAKDIAEGMGLASKSVSGAMRKLVTDGYVEKVGKDPVVYSITESGKNIVFEEN